MKSELLAPAGSPEALDAAVGEGADAVYLGLKDFNARLRSANFTYAQFESALRSLRRMKKKVYVTVNTVFEQREADRMYQLLKYLASQGPDAIIVQDFGVAEMVKTQFPSLRLHASTQMNIASARGANALSRHGFSRVVLARELTPEELRSIKDETNLELEVFVHGALCISISGLCLFSSFLGGKSANRGMCTQACRRLYHCAGYIGIAASSGAASSGAASSGANNDSSESGYYFSPADLQLLERVPDLADAGITALKIEGRMKSASYVGTVVSAYRLVIDAVAHGNEEEIRRSIERGREILRNDFARPKTRYFFDGVPSGAADWLNPDQDGGTGISLGTILKVKGSGSERHALVSVPPDIALSARDSVRIHYKNDSGRVSRKLTYAEASGSGYWISAPEGSAGDSVYLIQTKAMSKRYAPVIAGNAAGGRCPGRDKAPDPLAGSLLNRFDSQSKRSNKWSDKPFIFTEGFYVAVSKPEDLYIVQSSRPQMVILPFSGMNVKYLLAENKPHLPFKPAEVILSLDPWFPQELTHGQISESIKQLTEKGYVKYIVNNLGHFSLFKGNKNAKLIAGPWLYIFNSWSLSFIASFGADGFISPLENNRQNLERTLGIAGAKKTGALQSMFFITVFSWPPLFNIRAGVSSFPDISSFSDNTGEVFSLQKNAEGCRVYPEKYFSIIDKIPFLKEAGFRRFIIDLSGSALKKANYRDLMKAVKENASANKKANLRTLPYSSRFNWKDGFYRA